MERLGFKTSKVFPSVYYHEVKNMKVVTHVDDFLSSGRRKDLDWFKRELERSSS